MRPWLLITLLVIVGLTSCTLGPRAEEQGYRFVEVEIEPFGDNGGMVYVTGTGRDVPFYAYVVNEMREPAENIVFEVTNVNENIVPLPAALASERIGDDGTLAGYENTEALPYDDQIAHDVAVEVPRRKYSTELRYHLCADAQTIIEDTVCIAPAQPSGSYDVTCEPTEKRVSGGQGAPVAIVGIRQSDTIDSVSLHFDVVNYGTGLVFSRDSDRCSFIPQNEAGIIDLTDVTIGGVAMPCARQERMGYDLQYQKYEGTSFTCTVDKSRLSIPPSSTVQLSISATFAYRYHVEAGRQAIIVREP